MYASNVTTQKIGEANVRKMFQFEVMALSSHDGYAFIINFSSENFL